MERSSTSARAKAVIGITVVWSWLAAMMTGLGAAQADSGKTIAGDYVCKADCRLSDAPPSIDVDGAMANCHSELGGIFYGRVLSSRSIYCFNMIGTLSADGSVVLWSNGGIWERRRR